MTREEKAVVIEDLKETLGNAPFFYLADSSSLPVSKINDFRRACFAQGIKVMVVKNKLIQKALESAAESKGYAPLFDVLQGPTTLMISENPKAPAKLIKSFRADGTKPELKAAYIDSSIFIGDDQLDMLTKLRTRDEVLGEIITILQSPMKNVLGAILSGEGKIAGIVKALEERKA
jgi:large subunit ribosomal protein L10